MREALQTLALTVAGLGAGLGVRDFTRATPPPAPEIVRAPNDAANGISLVRRLRDCTLLSVAGNGAMPAARARLDTVVEAVRAGEPSVTAAVHVHDLRTNELFDAGEPAATLPVESCGVLETLTAARPQPVGLADTLAALDIVPLAGHLSLRQATRPWAVLFNATLLDRATSERVLGDLAAASPRGGVEHRATWAGGAASCGLVYALPRVYARCAAVAGADPAALARALDALVAGVDAEMVSYRFVPDAQAGR